MRDHEQAFREKGARLAAIGLGDVHYAQAFRAESEITFPLLVDDRTTNDRRIGRRVSEAHPFFISYAVTTH